MKTKFIIGLLIIAVAVVLRVIPHAPNFVPITAIALFGGVYFSKKAGLIIPLSAMVISDFFVGFYQPKLMAFVYLSFVLFVFLGFWLKTHKKWHTIGATAVLSSGLFFVITNYAVWLFTPWYAKTFSGLMQCYIMALPFLTNTLLGDLFYAAVFFGAYELSVVWVGSIFRKKENTSVSAVI